MILSHQQTTKMAISQSKYLRSLSVWIGFVAIMALGNTVQCFIDPSFLSSRLYTRNPSINGQFYCYLNCGIGECAHLIFQLFPREREREKSIYNRKYRRANYTQMKQNISEDHRQTDTARNQKTFIKELSMEFIPIKCSPKTLSFSFVCQLQKHCIHISQFI